MKKKILFILILSLAINLIACQVENKTEDAIKSEGPFLENTAYNFRIYAPDSWRGEVEFKEEQTEEKEIILSYEIYSKTIRDENNELGYLGKLFLYDKEYFKSNKESIMNTVPSIHLGTNNFGELVILKASDVNYDIENEKQTELYTKLYKEIDELNFAVCST